MASNLLDGRDLSAMKLTTSAIKCTYGSFKSSKFNVPVSVGEFSSLMESDLFKA